ncbi:MAG: hypothetical protein NC310_07000 [Roseburia sp.]|nr:hypothetical protein [Anaeroplasma bactoclasticum]MCM1196795.1 hypothetical protein [Roseburia sp.]MCM1557266.1 hypothetical protein [Anaeroplasma bactoclasticum]
MKSFKILASLLLLFLFTSCLKKNAYTKPLIEGIFTSEESFTIEEKEYTASKLIVSEITLKEFNQANKLNVLQDFSLKTEKRKYYSFQFYFLDNQNEIPIDMHFLKKCNPHATGSDIYIIGLEIPNGNENLHYTLDLHVATLESYYYSLIMNLGNSKSVILKYLKA